MKKICKLGVWDDTVPGIEIDETGISNYAKLFYKLTESYPRGEKGKSDWEKILIDIKKSGRKRRYDCIIGVSGGTDSSYLLHLMKEYGLRILAVNLDNGWNSEIAVKNIKRVTKALNIDLFTYVIDYEEIKDLLRTYMLAGLPWIDMPTDLAIKAVLYKLAIKEKIKYILRGNDFRSEGSQPIEWTYGDGKQLKYMHKKFGRVALKTYPNYTISAMLLYGVIKQIKSIYPFYYLDYNKQTAQKLLIQKFGWEYYGGHHFENIFTKFAIFYWLYEKFNIDKRKITFSAQILSGQISRDFALKELTNKPYPDDFINSQISFILKKLDFSDLEFNRLMNSQNKSYTDYPYYRFLVKNLNFLSKNIFRLVFKHKPQSVFQAEIRKNN